MRFWSIHPKYLPWQHLGACWRSALSVQEDVANQTGIYGHPQLKRFIESFDPANYLSLYLVILWLESKKRKLNYDFNRINEFYMCDEKLDVTVGQIDHEFKILQQRLLHDDYKKFKENDNLRYKEGKILQNPLFDVIYGGIESWESERETTLVAQAKNSKMVKVERIVGP